MFRDLRDRGMDEPKLITGDGALGCVGRASKGVPPHQGAMVLGAQDSERPRRASGAAAAAAKTLAHEMVGRRTLAIVKLRTKVTKSAGSKKARLRGPRWPTSCWTPPTDHDQQAQERWRRLNGHELVTDVVDAVEFKDGFKVTEDETTTTEKKVAA